MLVSGAPYSAGGKAIACVSDQSSCGCAIVSGSSKMFCNGKQVARQGDVLSCGGIILAGFSSIDVG
ncbi:MAG: PAAR domain-containing protein [Brucella intermedia]